MTLRALHYSCCLALLIITAGCSQHSDNTPTQPTELVAKITTPTQTLHFSGHVQPIHIISITSPVDGKTIQGNVSYGDIVHQGQDLLSIEGSQLTDTYRKDVRDYLEKKNALTQKQNAYRSNKTLFDAGFIARDDLDNSLNAYRSAQLDFSQSDYVLKKMLQQTNIDAKQIESLSLARPDAVAKLLAQPFNSITVRAPKNGVVLRPTDNNNSSHNSTFITSGTAVKTGDAILSIGDMRGLRIQVQVDQNSILHIHDGMAATIRIAAAPALVLNGTVSHVSIQTADSVSNDSDATYPITVTIPHLKASESKQIRIGMTANITLQIKEKPAIVLPFNAIHRTDTATTVTKRDHNGQSVIVPVTIRRTTPTAVIIDQGVNAGDIILITKPSHDSV